MKIAYFISMQCLFIHIILIVHNSEGNTGGELGTCCTDVLKRLKINERYSLVYNSK